LKALGYKTHHVGKWHMGHISPMAWPDAVGFDTWFGFLSQWLLRGPYQHPHTDDMFSRPSYNNPWLSDGPDSSKQYEGHLSDIVLARTLSLVQEASNQGQPWFINHWFYLPHNPMEPAQRYLAGHEDSARGRYMAMLEQLDDNVGLILQALAESGQAENTLVVIASDNGGTNKQVDNNWPYYGKKAQFYEGGVRTPMMMRWPGNFPAGHIIDNTVSITDIMPTLINAAGGQPIAELDGLDLTGLLQNDKALEKRELFWEYHAYDRYGFSVLSADGRWRLLSHALNWPPAPGAHLSDLKSDPSSKKNVAAEYPEQVSALVAKYEQWFKQVHRVNLEYTRTDNKGRALLTGDDLQRGPGNGAYSFAIAVSDIEMRDGDPQSSIVEQAGVWNLAFDPVTHQVKAQFGGYKLKALLADKSSCQSIIVAAEFHRRLTNWKESSSRVRAKLYVNGEQVDEIDTPGFISVADSLVEPTYIGALKDGGGVFSGTLSEPQIYNTVVSPINYLQPKDIHARLCSEQSSVAGLVGQ
jgi:hypothetical protein